MKRQNYEYLDDDVLHVYIPENYPLRVKLMMLASLFYTRLKVKIRKPNQK